jgi:cytosine/uracil/thiamine/allantoin permease
VALVAGMVMTALCAQTTHFKGPISVHVLSGADISPLVGMLVGGALYWLLCRSQPDPGPAAAGAPSAGEAVAAAPGLRDAVIS